MPIMYHERTMVELVETGELILTDDWKIDWGDVRRLKRKKPWWTTRATPLQIGSAEHLSSSGFCRVVIKEGDKYISCQSHRLIWQFLYGDIPTDLEIKHINGVRTDNRPENLEVTEHQKILKYAQSRIGDYVGAFLGEEASWAKLTKGLLTQAHEEVLGGKSVRQIAREMDVNPITLNDALIGNTWKASFTSTLKKDRRVKVPKEKRAQLIEDFRAIPRYPKSGRKERGEVERLLAKYGVTYTHMRRIIEEAGDSYYD